MICGSPGMLRDLKHLLEDARLQGRQHLDARRLRHRARLRREVSQHGRTRRRSRRQAPARAAPACARRRRRPRATASCARRPRCSPSTATTAAASRRSRKAAKSYDRMIYYYFGSKEGLFIAVLEEHLPPHRRGRGRASSSTPTRPVESLTAVIRFVLGYYREEPRVRHAAQHREPAQGRHIAKSLRAREYSSRCDRDHRAAAATAASRRGCSARDVAARDLYLLIAATGYFYTSNRHTLTAFLGEPLETPEARGALGRLRDRDGAAHGRAPTRRRIHPTHGGNDMAEVAAGAKSGKVVIRNIGLLLSGDIDRPILDADTIVVERRADRRGRQGEGLRHSKARRPSIDAQAAPASRPGLIDSHVHPVFGDWTPRQSQLGWIDSHDERRRDDHDLGRRGAPARPAQGHRRPEGAGHHRAARLRQLPPRRRQGAGRRAGDREGHGRERLQGPGRGRRQACSARSAWAR